MAAEANPVILGMCVDACVDALVHLARGFVSGEHHIRVRVAYLELFPFACALVPDLEKTQVQSVLSVIVQPS